MSVQQSPAVEKPLLSSSLSANPCSVSTLRSISRLDLGSICGTHSTLSLDELADKMSVLADLVCDSDSYPDSLPLVETVDSGCGSCAFASHRSCAIVFSLRNTRLKRKKLIETTAVSSIAKH